MPTTTMAATAELMCGVATWPKELVRFEELNSFEKQLTPVKLHSDVLARATA